MQHLTDRLNRLKTYYGLSGRALAARLEIKPNSINNYLSGRTEPSLEFVMRILQKFPNVSAEWLMRGQGQMQQEQHEDGGELLERLRSKDAVIKELRSIILEKNRM